METTSKSEQGVKNAVPDVGESKDFVLESASLVREEHMEMARRYCGWSEGMCFPPVKASRTLLMGS